MGNRKKMAVVVGATGNLGKCLCDTLRAAGYDIDPTWERPDHPDATKADSYKNLPNQVDLAIYLPGLNIVKPVGVMSEEEWDQVFDVNIKGAFLFAAELFRRWIFESQIFEPERRMSLVFVSSIMATHPYPGRAAYAASKAALEGLTRALAVEGGPVGISAHGIRLGHLPGLMKTTATNPALLDAVRMATPSGEVVRMEDVASYILWLAEGGSRSVSGSVFDFDPAYTINRWPLRGQAVM